MQAASFRLGRPNETAAAHYATRRCHDFQREGNMKIISGVALGLLVGIAIGAAAVQGLHAQTKPLAYQVIEVDVKDPELYAQYQAKAMPLQLQYSARFIARGGKVESFAGDPPKRAVIAVYDNIEKVEALRDLPEYKALEALRDKAANYHSYIVEGATN
jgi:uncharacterized protein (DUF1330 family)